MTKIVVLLSIIMITSGRASADASAPVDVAAQISPRGLAFLASEIPRYLPRVFNASGFTNQLVDCPFTDHDTDLTLSNVRSSVSVTSLSITPSTDRLRVRLVVSASGSAKVRVTRPYGCVGYPLECNAGFQVSRAVAVASFTPTLQGGAGAGGAAPSTPNKKRNGVKLKKPDVDLYISKDNVSITISDCGFAGTLANLILPLFKGYIIDEAVKNLTDMVKDEVPRRVESLLSGVTRASGEVPDFDVSGQLSVLRTRSRGVAAGAAIDISPKAQGSCTLQSVDAPVSPAMPSLDSHSEHVGVAVARSTLEKALLALWRAGGLCGESDKLRDLGVPHELPGWGAFLLGLSGSATLAVHTHKAPQVELVSGDGARVRVRLPEATLEIDGTGPNGPTTVTARCQAQLELQLRLEPDTRSIVLDVLGAQVSGVTMSATDPTGLRLNPTVVSTLVRSLAIPLLERKLSGMEVGPQVLHEEGGMLDSYYLNLTRGSTTESHLLLFADVFRAPAYDHTAPSTTLESNGESEVNDSRVRLRARGWDGGTPRALLRYRWRVDGGSWSTPSYAATFSADLQPGAHTIEVVAVDLAGNTDATPARMELEVKPGGVGKGDLPAAYGGDASGAGGCTTGRSPPGSLPAVLLLVLAMVFLRRLPGGSRSRGTD